MRLEAGLPYLLSKFSNFKYIDNNSEELPSVQYNLTQNENGEFNLIFEVEEHDKVKITYQSPPVKSFKFHYNLEPFCKTVSIDKFDIKHNFLEEILIDFKNYVNYWHEGIKYVSVLDRNYIENLAQSQAKILNKTYKSHVPNKLSQSEFDNLVLETKARLIQNIESFLKIAYLSVENNKIEVIYATNADMAKRLIKQIVSDAFSTIIK